MGMQSKIPSCLEKRVSELDHINTENTQLCKEMTEVSNSHGNSLSRDTLIGAQPPFSFSSQRTCFTPSIEGVGSVVSLSPNTFLFQKSGSLYSQLLKPGTERFRCWKRISFYQLGWSRRFRTPQGAANAWQRIIYRSHWTGAAFSPEVCCLLPLSKKPVPIKSGKGSISYWRKLKAKLSLICHGGGVPIWNSFVSSPIVH